ncbi:MAG: RraA family protein [Sphingobacteriales bacterium]|jgi:regulator of RNase E activity RraA
MIRISTMLMIFMIMSISSIAQTISKEELTYLTGAWTGERFPDGRPKVSDQLIERAKKIGIEEAWQILNNEGYKNQFEGDWKMVHDNIPVVGRVVTARFIPSRPDLELQIKTRGKEQGRKGNTNAWPIEVLQKGDVYVAEAFGKIAQGTLIGDNLGTSIFNKTGNGVIFDGAARDLSGLAKIKGFNAFVRDFHPSFLEEVVLAGLNTPIRIGKAIVMPGDLVISEREGVLFIPAHLAEKVISTAEFIAVRDRFSKDMLGTNRFNAGQIDNQWTEEIKSAFIDWIKKHPEEPQYSKTELEKFLEKRTW